MRKYCSYQYMFLFYARSNVWLLEDCHHNKRHGWASQWASIWTNSSFLGLFYCIFHLAQETFLRISLILTLDWGFCSHCIITFSCAGYLGRILGQRLTLECFTSLLSLNSYFNSISQTIVPLFMLLVKRAQVGMGISILLSFEMKGFSSWNDSSQSLHSEWNYCD